MGEGLRLSVSEKYRVSERELEKSALNVCRMMSECQFMSLLSVYVKWKTNLILIFHDENVLN